MRICTGKDPGGLTLGNIDEYVREVFVQLPPENFGIQKVSFARRAGFTSEDDYYNVVARWLGRVWHVAEYDTQLEAEQAIRENLANKRLWLSTT